MKRQAQNDDFNWKNYLTDSSKMLIDSAVNLLCEKPDDYAALLELVDEAVGPKSQRAARAASHAIVEFPDLFGAFVPRIINSLLETRDESVKFHLLRTFAEGPLPTDEDLRDALSSFCFDALESATKKIAIKVYSVIILSKLTDEFPELKPELAMIFRRQLEGAPPAMVCVLRRELAKFGEKDDFYE